MSSIAKKLNVTAGTLTTSMNRLVRQNYAIRQRSTEDRRVVMITLTEKGERAYRHHAKFHEQMTDAVIQSLEPEELLSLIHICCFKSGSHWSYEGNCKRTGIKAYYSKCGGTWIYPNRYDRGTS